MEGINWCLQIFPRGRYDGDYIACYLKRETSVSHQVKFKLACLNLDGSSLTEWISCDGTCFTKNETNGSDTFVERNAVFVDKRMKYLPNGTLTVDCRIARNKIYSSLCKVFVRTRIEVCWQSISEQIEEFSCLESKSIVVPSASLEKPILKVNVSLGEATCCDENLVVEIFSENHEQRKFSTCKVFLLDAAGSKLKCGKSDIWFDKGKIDQKWIFPLIFTKWDLMAKKDLYLPGDILTLQFECSSSLGISNEVTENIDFVVLSDGGSVSTRDGVGESSALEDLGSLLRENILCDVNLQTRTKTFPAHKAILSARSPVFKAMFTNDLKEKTTNHVDVKDFDDETVRRLLSYIYTNTVENLQWKTAFQLYVAADKYSVKSLKKKCAYLLEENLDLDNVCECLELADTHKDEYLKNSVQDFVLRHDKDVIGSIEWNDLEIGNSRLTSETMGRVYKKAKWF
ncbi:Speckle-type POZ protein [Araneus ventricosus]|uniref:Speckle-type POZ protein n=1 Tax=Araneus ventricosus TaxID=182803 RepID=A0A4Y2S3J5_ARAVE|nr:Speckle-type POZ protein [Araneus ventricosus]